MIDDEPSGMGTGAWIGIAIVAVVMVALVVIAGLGRDQSFFSPAPTPTWYVTPVPTLYQMWDGIMICNYCETIFIWQEPGVADLAYNIDPGQRVHVLDEKCVDVCYYQIDSEYGVGWIDQEFVRRP